MNPQQDVTWTISEIEGTPVLVLQAETPEDSEVFKTMRFEKLLLRRLSNRNGPDSFALVDLTLSGIILEATMVQAAEELMVASSSLGLWLLFLQYTDPEKWQVTSPWVIDQGRTTPLINGGGTINHWKVGITEEPIR